MGLIAFYTADIAALILRLAQQQFESRGCLVLRGLGAAWIFGETSSLRSGRADDAAGVIGLLAFSGSAAGQLAGAFHGAAAATAAC